MSTEYVVWGKLPNEALWEERPLKEGIGSLASASDWQQFMERKGYVNVRIARVDLTSVPDFAKTLRV